MAVKVISVTLFYGGCLTYFLRSDTVRSLGLAAALFMIPILTSALFWGMIGGISTAIVSNATMILIVLVKVPRAVTPGYIALTLLSIGLGAIVGKLFDMRRLLKKERDEI
jgi:hypothetical protein